MGEVGPVPKTRRCPNCKLISPGSAETCDCGYSFKSGELGDVPAGRERPGGKVGNGMGQILFGVALIIIGIGVTVVTHDSATRNGGGTYIVAYGPILAGVIGVIRGLARS